LIVPLQEAVFREEDKKRFPSVNQTVTSSIVAFYIFFAITCWAAFGDSIKTALTASLPPGPFSTIAQLAYSIAVIFSFPLQAFPALEVVFRHSSGVRTDPSKAMKLNILSSLMICLLGALAFVAIDYLGNVVSLLGSLVGIPIALIYPPLMHNILVRDGSMATTWMNNLVAGVGFLAMGATSYTTIAQWDRGAE
jgi:proton-coupled amino acid transporter